MYKHIIKFLLSSLACFVFSFSLTACSSFFDKDNTPQPAPLIQFTPEMKPHRLWSTNTGSGSGDEYLKINPVVTESAIFTTGHTGRVTAVNKMNGHILWQTDTGLPLATGAGVSDGLVIVGSREGDVVALQESDGKQRWRTTIPGEILAQPAIGNGAVIIKTTDGFVYALSIHDGHQRWLFRQTEPNLILRGASAPVIGKNSVIVGFANGNLAKLALNDGQLWWQQAVAIPEGAFAIQRMIDIDANPLLFDHYLYAATYQGNIASFDYFSGRLLWSHDISSFTGMIADQHHVYISDAKSNVWAFDADSGLVNWRQDELKARVVSGPASMGHYVVVGDAEGYLHWLDKNDGHFVARDHIGSKIYAAPIADNGMLYVLTDTGYLVAYTLG